MRDAVPKAVFVRDPAVRLSAWLDKVRGGRDTAALGVMPQLGLPAPGGHARLDFPFVRRLQVVAADEPGALASAGTRGCTTAAWRWGLGAGAWHFFGRADPQHAQRDAECLLRGLDSSRRSARRVGRTRMPTLVAIPVPVQACSTSNCTSSDVRSGRRSRGYVRTRVARRWHRTDAERLAPRLFAEQPDLLRQVKQLYAATTLSSPTLTTTPCAAASHWL